MREKLKTKKKKAKTKVYAKEDRIPFRGEIALAGTSIFAGQQMMPFNPSALVTRKGLRVFDIMRKDEQVKAALWFKKLAVLSTGWEILSPEGKPPDWEPTRFIRDQLGKVESTFNSSLLELLSAFDYGYAVSEKVYHEIEEGEFAGKIGLKAIKSKTPHSMNFKTDEFGNILDDGLIQRTVRGDVRLPISKFVVFTYQKEFSNWYGRSDLESAYRAWWIKENAYRWLAMLLERFGIPPIFALYDPTGLTPEQIDALLSVIDRMQAATAGAIPRANKDSLEMWSPQLAGQVNRVFIPALDMFNRDIARALLMPGLLGLTPTERVGSFARARIEFDVFLLTINHLRRQIQDDIVMDQIVRPLVMLNFPVDVTPMFRLLPISDETSVDLMKQWAVFVKEGVVSSGDEDEDHIRSRFGFPKRDEDAERVVPPDDEEEDEEDNGDNEDLLNVDAPLKLDRGIVGQLKETSNPFVESDHPKDYQFRRPNKFEKKVDFARIDRELDEVERRAIEKIVRRLIDVRDRFLKVVRTRFDGKTLFVKNLKEFRGLPKVREEIGAFLEDAYLKGVASIRRELPQTRQLQAEAPNFIPTQAIKFLKTKKFFITGVLDDTLRKDARNILLRAIETGEPINDTVRKLRRSFEPFVGDPAVIRDGKVISPHRLETIVRTNATDAYNRGRIVQARKAGDLLTGFEYSAIIDKQTTEVCRFLDGKIIRRDDPNVDSLKPPRHFNCFINPQTRFYTEDGWKAWSKIKIGDKILTHKGRFRSVTEKISHTSKCPVEAVEITFYSEQMRTGAKNRFARSFTVTLDHPILVNKSEWKRAGDIRPGDSLSVLARRCELCGKPSPWWRLRCSKSCAAKHSLSEETKERLSKCMKAQYVDGSRDRYKTTREANRVTRQMVKDGTHVTCDPRFQKLGRQAMSKKNYGGTTWLEERLGWGLKQVSLEPVPQFRIKRFGRTKQNHPKYCFVDFAFPKVKLAIEADGWRHQTEDIKGHDAIRDRELEQLGWTVLRFSHQQIDKSLMRCVRKIERVLSNHTSEYFWIDNKVDFVCPKTIGLLRGSRPLYNLAIDEDESYVAAQGVVMHNCRSVLVPITLDIPVNEEEFLTEQDAGKGLQLSGSDFGGPPRVTGLRKPVSG